MDKAVGGMIQKIMGAGEKKAPVKSMKLKVKFDTGGKKKGDKYAEKRSKLANNYKHHEKA